MSYSTTVHRSSFLSSILNLSAHSRTTFKRSAKGVVSFDTAPCPVHFPPSLSVLSLPKESSPVPSYSLARHHKSPPALLCPRASLAGVLNEAGAMELCTGTGIVHKRQLHLPFTFSHGEGGEGLLCEGVTSTFSTDALPGFTTGYATSAAPCTVWTVTCVTSCATT